MIGKGLTTRCEKSQFGFSNSLDIFYKPNVAFVLDNADVEHEDEIPAPATPLVGTTRHYTTHSASGWVDTNIWLQYLHFLRKQILIIGNDPNAKENTIILICDGYAAHHNKTAQEEAAKLNIELIPVPNGTTDECQPLARRIFGALKSQMRAELSQHIADAVLQRAFDRQETPLYKPPLKLPYFTKPAACEVLIRLWDNLPVSQVLNGWQIAIYGKEDGEDV